MVAISVFISALHAPLSGAPSPQDAPSRTSVLAARLVELDQQAEQSTASLHIVYAHIREDRSVDIRYMDISQANCCTIASVSIKNRKLEEGFPDRAAAMLGYAACWGDDKLPLLEKSIPLSKALKSFEAESLLDDTWNLSEIGHIIVQDKEQPWRWGITFIKKRGREMEKRSFILEKDTWTPQDKPIETFYFSC